MNEKDVETFVVSNPKDTHSAIQKLAESPKLIGLDLEWDVVSGKENEEKLDAVHLAKPDGYCALFRLDILQGVPDEVIHILEDPNYIKVGVDTRLDVSKLYYNFKIRSRGVLDIRFLARKKGIDGRGMASLANAVFEFKMKKLQYSTRNRSGHLNDEKEVYPAISGVKVFQKLNHRIIEAKWGDEWKQWSQDEYHSSTVKMWKKYFGRKFRMVKAISER